ncbi:fumarylacetoacetate hydrolase family protein [Synoicihabitans lomoniglobus]|uniref:Fumarylacetoacetate hydrolase family protein n=1 Tax=Synoicihabitans lomoniglobus TaxID=2909285 RepID=A0AAF0CR66_9BACT|nr:fumarylacetoacetate hydrolase family protein [Opitutaceae bacterium LMO-M01]WED66529.1 fumarylacetoacetate hydrolase family protein [Opitutaceae bacterium LMO-M01]
MASIYRLYPSAGFITIEHDGSHVKAAASFGFDALFTASDPLATTTAAFAAGTPVEGPGEPTPLIEHQEVWAAGVTYFRSRTARMEESKDAGGGDFYDRVYDAPRPELFMKATPHRVAAPGGAVRIRKDSAWNVPEPELTLAINAAGKVFGFTVGNDMSSRDIEGENPLYLPQAKSYALSAALGPCLVVTDELPSPDTVIAIEIIRAGETVFSGDTKIDQIKRPLLSLAEWLYRDNEFPAGAFLMTGTGVVPDDDFTLLPADEVRITIEPVGTLSNIIIQ